VIEGEPFEARSQFDASCRYAMSAVDWLIDLSALTVIARPPIDMGESFQRLVDRFSEIYKPIPEHRAYLNDLVLRLKKTPPPAVFQHGDPGTWNLLVTEENQVAFLDWENALEHGIPLWDLLYFLRSYCVAAGQKSGNYGVLPAIEHFMLEDSPLAEFIVDAFQRYCQRVTLDPALVEPLFFMNWVFWGVKQAALVEAVGLQTAHYVQLIKLCIERRDAPTLARIFALEANQPL
jgi:aminoglycoside phosphotransferase (APT) family kinase protein